MRSYCVHGEDSYEMMLRTQLDLSITTIGKRCPRLTQMKLLTLGSEISTVGYIARDEKSEYTHHHVTTYVDDSLPSTSAWYVRNYESDI